MSKKVRKNESRMERLRELSGAAQGELVKKVSTLETEVREQKKSILVGAVVFLVGLAVGAAISRRRD